MHYSNDTKGTDMSSGTYRMSINGFRCITETIDDMWNGDGQHDELYFRVSTRVVHPDGTVKGASDDASMIMGDVRGFTNRLQVGSAVDWLGSRTGGVISGDTYPTPTPWIKNVDLDLKDGRFPPYQIWEGELSDDDDTVTFITPSLWEYDPTAGAAERWAHWQINTDAAFGKRAKEIFGGIWPAASPVFDAVSLGLQTFGTIVDLWGPLGATKDRPIGLQRDPNDPHGSVFNPRIFALTRKTAEYLTSANLSGLGPGIVGVEARDDPHLQGNYLFFIELEKIGGPSQFPDGAVAREVSAPEVYVIFGGAKFRIPDPATLARLYGGWAAVRVVPDGTLATTGVGEIPADETLLREEHDAVVWRMDHGRKRWVISPTVLAKYGGWNQVRIVPDQAVLRIPQGEPLSS